MGHRGVSGMTGVTGAPIRQNQVPQYGELRSRVYCFQARNRNHALAKRGKGCSLETPLHFISYFFLSFFLAKSKREGKQLVCVSCCKCSFSRTTPKAGSFLLFSVVRFSSANNCFCWICLLLPLIRRNLQLHKTVRSKNYNIIVVTVLLLLLLLLSLLLSSTLLLHFQYPLNLNAGSGFKSRPGNWLSCLRFFVVFLCPFGQMLL